MQHRPRAPEKPVIVPTRTEHQGGERSTPPLQAVLGFIVELVELVF
jgi:hypothetical protein